LPAVREIELVVRVAAPRACKQPVVAEAGVLAHGGIASGGGKVGADAVEAILQGRGARGWDAAGLVLDEGKDFVAAVQKEAIAGLASSTYVWQPSGR
jgi:hypothetical protein